MARNPKVEIIIDGDSGPLSRALATTTGKLKAFDKLTRRMQNKMTFSKGLKAVRGLERDTTYLRGSVLMLAKAWAIAGGAAVASAAVGAAALMGMPVLIFGIGAAFISQSKVVKNAWSSAIDDIKKKGQALAKPIEKPMANMAGAINKAFDAMSPALSRMFTAIAPQIDKFNAALPGVATKMGAVFEKGLGAGMPVLEAFGKALSGPILDGLGKMFDALDSPALVSFVGALGNSLGQILPLIGEMASKLAPLGTQMLNVLPMALQGASTALQAIIPPLLAVGNWLMKHPKLVTTLVTAFVGLAVAFRVINTVLAAFRVVMFAVNLVMAANPIMLVVIAIVALIAIFVILYMRCETFRNIVQAVFAAVKVAAMVLWTGIKAYFTAIWTVIKVAVNLIKAYINMWIAVFKLVVKGAIALYNGVASAMGKVVAEFKSIKSSITGALSSLYGTLKNAGKKLIQSLIDGIISKIGSVGSAMGKIAKKIKAFLPGSPVKEGPLTSWNRGAVGKRLVNQGLITGIKKSAPALNRAMNDLTGGISFGVSPSRVGFSSDAVAGTGGGTAVTYQITVNAPVGSNPADIGRELADYLGAYKRVGGTV